MLETSLLYTRSYAQYLEGPCCNASMTRRGTQVLNWFCGTSDRCKGAKHHILQACNLLLRPAYKQPSHLCVQPTSVLVCF